MKNPIKFIFLIGFLFCLNSYLFAQPGRGFNQSQITKLYDASSEITMTGDIIKLDTVENDFGRFPGLLITVKNEKQEYPVYIAPLWYLSDKKISMKTGEKIKVTGSKVNYQEKDQIIARHFEYQKKEITVRDEKGIPVWAGKRMGPGKGRRGYRR